MFLDERKHPGTVSKRIIPRFSITNKQCACFNSSLSPQTANNKERTKNEEKKDELFCPAR